MALVLKDRVKETTTTTGTGTITLAGAATGFQSFAAIGDGNSTYYSISGGSEWEVGIGTYTASGTTLSRTTVLASSNAGALVTFSAGTKDVICSNAATKTVMAGTGAFTDQFNGTFTTGVVVDYLSGAGRISVGSTDKLQFYSGGVGGTLMGEALNNGNWDFNGTIKAGVGTAISGATNPLVEASGAASGYVQMYIHNNTNGTSSSADIAAYPNNGTDASGWIDMGITSQTYSDAAFGITAANEGYILMSAPSGSGTTGSMIFATDSTGSANDIQFFTNGFNQAKSSVELIIKGLTGNVGIKTQSPTAALHLPAGTAAANTAPLKLTTGTVQTTPEAGTYEYDGKVFYGTAEASQRGVIPNEQFVILTTNYTTPAGSNNTLKQAFNTTTNGALTVAGNTTYLFECLLNISTMSSTSGNLQFGIGGTAVKTRTNYMAIANKAVLTQITATNNTFGTVATAVVLTGNNTVTTGYMFIRGSLVIGTGGTIIPSIALSQANAAVIQAGSYFKLTPIGSNTVTQIGNWS